MDLVVEDGTRVGGAYFLMSEATGPMPPWSSTTLLTTLPEAVRRLAPGMFADVAMFDAATIADKATYAEPQQFAVGMRHVLVNGQPALLDGEMTNARPGRAVRGPGWNRCPSRG